MKLTSFVEELLARCASLNLSIAFPEGDDERIIEACRWLLSKSACTIHIYGDERVISQQLSGMDSGKVVGEVAGKVAGKIVIHNIEKLSARLENAAELLESGRVHAVLAGIKATTADVVRAGISGVGLADGCRTVSGSFIMDREGHRVLLGDAGVVPDPSPKQLVDIAYQSVLTWRHLVTNEPARVAFLSFSTKGSADHPMVDKMQQGIEKFKKKYPDVICDGELQFDAAVVPEIAEKKCPGSPVAGKANCFIFPNLDAANISYKIMQRLAGYHAYGPILQGLAKPYSDLSRGSTVNDVIASALINLLRSQQTLTI